MNKPLTLALICFGSFQVNAQKLSTSFQPVIKDLSPEVRIVQHTDGNLLVYGKINYIGETPSGSLVKLNSQGKPVTGFQQTFTDGNITSVQVVAGGKILILGDYRYVNGVRVPSLVRLNADGSIDSGFHLDVLDRVNRFVVQSTGKIVAAVSLGQPGGFQSKLVRFNTQGTTDGTFVFGLAPGFYNALAVDMQDNVLVWDGYFIRRQLVDGAIDNTFNNIDLSPNDNPGTITIQRDGKILSVNGNNPWRVRRFNANGTLDNSFTSVVFEGGYVLSIVERHNGKLVMTGGFRMVDGNPAIVVELNTDGTFSKGLEVVNTNNCVQIYEDADQNIFVTGGFRAPNNLGLTSIVKLKPNYAIDPAFDPNLSAGPGYSYPNAVGVQSDGRMLVGGGYSSLGAGNDSTRLVRLLSDGSADPTFHPAINHDNTTNYPNVYTLAVQDDDKIVVGGNLIFPGASTGLGRLLPDGQLDNSFTPGTGPAVAGLAGNALVRSVVIRNSRIYVCGNFDSFNAQTFYGFVILDMDGKLISPQQNGVPINSYIQDMAVQSTGKIVLCGSFPFGPSDNRNFIRINADGSVDNSFNLSLAGNYMDLDVDDQDNILVAGSALQFQNNGGLRRVTAAGVLDNSLNLGTGFAGKESTNLVIANFVIALPGSKIAIGGFFAGYNNQPAQGFALLDATGTLIPVDNVFDSISHGMAAAYNKKSNILGVKGYYTRNHGQIISSGTKLVFPITSSAANFNASVSSESSMGLSWTGSYAGADGIVVERSTTDASNYSKIATLLPSVNTYTVNGLNEVTPYYFRIKGSNGAYTGAPLEDHDTTAIAPEVALPATDITTNSFTANWTYLAGTDSTLLQVSGDNFSTFVSGYEHAVTTSGTKAVTSLQDGKAYQYRVKRFKNKWASGYSANITVNVITGLEGGRGVMKVHAYPNPFQGTVSVDFLESVDEATATIYSVQGELIGNYRLGGGTHAEIDTRSLSSGLFILTVSCGESYRKFKVVKSTE
jgi:uncharacterized delta-60 repeat protein